MTDIEREYIIPLRRGFQNTPRYKRTHKAIRVLREFLVKNMKSDNVKIGSKLNDFLWRHGIQNPPAKVKVIATKDKEGVVRAELVGHKYVDFKQIEESAEPQNLKEKLQSKVSNSKSQDSEQKTEEKQVAHEIKKGVARTPEGDVKQEEIDEEQKTETKPKTENQKVESQKSVETEVKPEN